MPRAPAGVPRDSPPAWCPAPSSCIISSRTRFCSLSEQLDNLKEQLTEEHDREVANLREENQSLRDALAEAQDKRVNSRDSAVPSSESSVQVDAVSHDAHEKEVRTAKQDFVHASGNSPYYQHHPQFKGMGMLPSSMIDELASNAIAENDFEHKAHCGSCIASEFCDPSCKAYEINYESDAAFAAGSQVSLYELLCEAEDPTPRPFGGEAPAESLGRGAADAWTRAIANAKTPEAKRLQLSNEALAHADGENIAQMLKDGLPAEEPTPQQPPTKQIGLGRVGPVHSGLRVLATGAEDFDEFPTARAPHLSTEFYNRALGSRFLSEYVQRFEERRDREVSELSGKMSLSRESYPCPTPATMTVSYDSDLVATETPADSREGHSPSDFSTPEASHPGEEFSMTFKPWHKDSIRKENPVSGVALGGEQALAASSHNMTVHLEPVIVAQDGRSSVEKPVFNSSSQCWSGLATGLPILNIEEAIQSTVVAAGLRRVETSTNSNQCFSPFRLHSRSRLAYSLVGLILIAYDLVSVPLHVFEPQTHAFSRIWSALAATFWTMDFIISVSTGADLGGKANFELRRLLRACTKNNASLDFCLVLSHWLTVVLCEAGAGASWPYFLIQCLRLVRLPRIHRMLCALSRVASSKLTIAALTMTRVVFFTFIVNHFMACAWYGVSRNRLSADIEHASALTRYAWSLRWAPLARFYAAEDFASLHHTLESTFVIAMALMFPAIVFATLCLAMSVALGLHRPVSELSSQGVDSQRCTHQDIASPPEVMRVKAQIQAEMLGRPCPHSLSPRSAALLARLREQIVTGHTVAL